MHSRLESYRPDADLSREDTGCNLQHISDRENIDGERGPAGTCTGPGPGLPGARPRAGRGLGSGRRWAGAVWSGPFTTNLFATRRSSFVLENVNGLVMFW